MHSPYEDIRFNQCRKSVSRSIWCKMGMPLAKWHQEAGYARARRPGEEDECGVHGSSG